YSILQGLAGTALLFLATWALLLQPLVPASQQYVRAALSGVEYWELSTGSRIAVRKIESKSGKDNTPIVFLHGGPGAYSVGLEQTWKAVAKLSESGGDVYFYDQAGGGMSDRLPLISRYSLDRHIADLKSFHERIGSDQVILIGSSFGATLASNYMARYPEDVSHVVFSGAGPMYNPDWEDAADGSLESAMSSEEKSAFDAAVNKPRLIAAIVLSEINPITAGRFLPSREAGSFFDKIANDHYMQFTVCNTENVMTTTEGFGFWSNRMTSRSLRENTDDPKTALRKNHTPALILRGACDYKAEAVARQYHSILPNSSYVGYEDAGHMFYWEKPEVFVREIRKFLNSPSAPTPASGK
ncbi:MAG: alpha/beta hydrolase, partial [Pseudomonadota bacterium]